uniref:Uncharacterized protein n=1 Tax=Rhizophora mucronata TaxID=61149 RepID=A0A2P2NEK1_RHIMU
MCGCVLDTPIPIKIAPCDYALKSE